jgi:hypothetical protein
MTGTPGHGSAVPVLSIQRHQGRTVNIFISNGSAAGLLR